MKVLICLVFGVLFYIFMLCLVLTILLDGISEKRGYQV